MTLYIAWFDGPKQIIKKIDEAGGWPNGMTKLIEAGPSNLFGSFCPSQFINDEDTKHRIIMTKEKYLDLKA